MRLPSTTSCAYWVTGSAEVAGEGVFFLVAIREVHIHFRARGGRQAELDQVALELRIGCAELVHRGVVLDEGVAVLVDGGVGAAIPLDQLPASQDVRVAVAQSLKRQTIRLGKDAHLFQ